MVTEELCIYYQLYLQLDHNYMQEKIKKEEGDIHQLILTQKKASTFGWMYIEIIKLVN